MTVIDYCMCAAMALGALTAVVSTFFYVRSIK